MKIKEGYVLRQVAGENIVIPSGTDLDLNMMITLNETGKFLWEQLQEEKTEQQLLDAVLAAYEGTDPAEALKYIKKFIDNLKKYDFLA